MAWRVPGMMQLEQTYALDVLAVILGQGRMSRLVRDLREERQLVTHIGVSNMTQRLQGVFYISAHLPEENLAVVEEAIAQHIRKFQTELVADTDIARIRTQVANRFIFGNEKPSDRTSLYGYYQCQLGDLTPALNYPARIQSIEAVDIQNAAQQYLSSDAYGIVTIKPAQH
jgi:predicted Zn-dependent peptidase